MRGLEPNNGEEPEQLEFPLLWHGRVIARDQEGAKQRIDAILEAHGFAEFAERGRSSKAGSYVTFRLSLTVPDREVFEAVTTSLEQIKGVKMVL